MSWPAPQPGLVIRYSYLWDREALTGREEGLKDRPCAVLLVLVRDGDAPRVRVLPITHTAPINPADAVEIPYVTKMRLGLDHDQSWVMLTEANDFFWPGPDLRPTGLGDPSGVVYGMLPPGFMKVLRERLINRWQVSRMRAVARTE